MNTRRRLLLAAAFCTAAGFWNRPARAGLCEIKDNTTNPDQAAMLDHLLAGDFVADGTGCGDGTIGAARVDDNDQNFDGCEFAAQAMARFSQTAIIPDNAGGHDHLVTYKITGTEVPNLFVPFGEELNLTPSLSPERSASNFNDVVIDLDASEVNAIPLPPALVGGIVLSGAIVVGRTVNRFMRR